MDVLYPDSDSRLRAIYDGTHAYIGLISPAGALLHCNRAMLGFGGNRREDVIGLPLWETPWFAHTPGAPELVHHAVRRAAAGEFIRYETTLQRPGGEALTFDFSLHPIRGEDGAVEYIVPEGRDITERLRAETALRDSESRYRTLLESIEDGFCIIEVLFDGDRAVDYRFIETNAAFMAQTGLPDAIGRTARVLVPDLEELWFEVYGRVALTGEAVRFQNGSEPMGRWFDVLATRIGAPEERKVALLFKDVTAAHEAARERDRLLLESETARAEAEAANRAKSEFLAVMSHELRTPLNAISGYADLIDMGVHGPVTDGQRKALQRIQISQRHLLGLINEVLNYARIETGTLEYDIERVPLHEALRGAESLVAPQAQIKDITLRIGDYPATVAVMADAEKLRQILVNLLSNAVKFTEEGGSITIAAEQRGDRVTIDITDTGIGIPEDKLTAIFDAFVQVRADLARPHEGTGLGLAISRDLARGMDGDLIASSRLGVGSVFTLLLPVG